jgi:hypothetical protein
MSQTREARNHSTIEYTETDGGPCGQLGGKTTGHKVSRILGERRIGRNDTLQYLIEWYPRWHEPAKVGLDDDGAIIEEWNAMKQDKAMTVQVGDITYLGDEVPSDNDHEVALSRMAEFLIKKIKGELGIKLRAKKYESDKHNFGKNIEEQDWEFASPSELAMAQQLRRDAGKSDNVSAAKILQESLNEGLKWRMRNMAQNNSIDDTTPLRYGEVKLVYYGEVDDDLDPEAAFTVKRPRHPVYEIIAPLLDFAFVEMSTDDWENPRVLPVSVKRLVCVFKMMIKHAPFALKANYVMFFARLFICSDKMSEMLKKEGILVSEDWARKTRAAMCWRYREDNKYEFRSAHDVLDTALHLRDWLQDIWRKQEGLPTVHKYGGFFRRPYMRNGMVRRAEGGMDLD